MKFLADNCTLHILTKEILDKCKPFTCGEEDLDNFFREDSLLYSASMLGNTYCYLLNEDPSVIVCAFTLSNESIRTDLLPGSRKKIINKAIPREKQMRRYPAVLIGRLGVNAAFSDKGIGTEVISFIAKWLIQDDTKAACRFLAVDAYNNSRTLHFYEEKCNFKYLFSREEQEAENAHLPMPLHTRYMYFDLLEIK